MRNETYAQAKANDFDASLFDLATRALWLARDSQIPKRQREQWAEIAQGLLQVRPDVRLMMHPHTVAETVGNP